MDSKSLEQDLLFAVVKDRYGHLLTDDELEEVRKTVTSLADFVRPLRAARLASDVEPFATFRPFRADRDV